MESRAFSPVDRFILHIDRGLRTLFGNPEISERTNPADDVPDEDLSHEEMRLSAALMRVNHAGEVSAQALYQGQSLTAKLDTVRDKMDRAAIEENDHLDWCAKRCHELGGHTSVLNPLWYTGSLCIGAMAGKAGDRWSLGFIVETEHQVVRHLDEHIARLPPSDQRSRAILEQMKSDEMHHATTALEAGGAELPEPVKKTMALVSKVMTRSAYWL